MLRSAFLAFIAAVALSAVGIDARAQGQPAASDPVLVENSTVKIRRSDYERELERLPPEIREGFANSERRVNDLLRRMLIESTLATQARADKLPEKPEYAARLAAEMDRLLAALKILDVEKAAEADFEARKASFEVRARELYTVDKAKYATPEQVQASHILFSTKTRSKEEAEKLAREARATIAAGADFSKVARDVSEDPSAKTNGGSLGWFARGVMDRAFEDAAFALKGAGEVSPPVLSSFGWHLIKLEGRRVAQPRTYEEVRDQIMAELKAKHVADRRDAFVATVRSDPTIRANREAIDALVVRVDPESVRRKVLDAAPGAMAPPSK
ncbi:MAG TPA: peptidylprolyl isomerase [Casimicrobiaceae bacterium]|nr:peptidylprolyl isomerase [Casimicrobiaceae bacterium]